MSVATLFGKRTIVKRKSEVKPRYDIIRRPAQQLTILIRIFGKDRNMTLTLIFENFVLLDDDLVEERKDSQETIKTNL